MNSRASWTLLLRSFKTAWVSLLALCENAAKFVFLGWFWSKPFSMWTDAILIQWETSALLSSNSYKCVRRGVMHTIVPIGSKVSACSLTSEQHDFTSWPGLFHRGLLERLLFHKSTFQHTVFEATVFVWVRSHGSVSYEFILQKSVFCSLRKNPDHEVS